MTSRPAFLRLEDDVPLSLPPGWRYFEAPDADDGGDAAIVYLRGLRGNPFPSSVYPDDELLEALTLAAREFEKATGRVFALRTQTAVLRGAGGRVLDLPEPVRDVTAVRVGGVALDLETLDVCGGTESDADGTDPRDAPSIAFLATGDLGYLSLLAGGLGGWPREEQGPIVEVDATWGYAEADGTTPVQVRQAVLALLQRALVPLNDVEGRGDLMRGAVIQEMTRGRGYMLSQQRLSTGVFLDREIDRIVSAFKRPARVLVSRSQRPGRGRRSSIL